MEQRIDAGSVHTRLTRIRGGVNVTAWLSGKSQRTPCTQAQDPPNSTVWDSGWRWNGSARSQTTTRTLTMLRLNVCPALKSPSYDELAVSGNDHVSIAVRVRYDNTSPQNTFP